MGDFPETSFAILADLEDRSFWFRARNAIVLTAVRRHLGDMTSYFELGCGTGYVLRAIAEAYPQARVVGGEPSEEGLAIARSRVPRASLVRVDGRDIPFRDEFDAAGAFDVLEHVDEDETVLGELRAALRPRGGLIVTVPQHRWLWSAADEFGGHRRRYNRRELVAKLQQSGFAPVYVTSFMTLVLPLLAVSRLRQRDLARFDATAELRLPHRIDRALERLVGAERLAIRNGLSLPVGGSLLAVARRR